MVAAIEFGIPINPTVPEGPSESANQDVVDLLGPNHRILSTHASEELVPISILRLWKLAKCWRMRLFSPFYFAR